MTFKPTSPHLSRALAERNYTELTPVQAGVLTEEAIGRDLLVSAQTGSGKTVAYGLAIAKDMLAGAERFARGSKPAALIVAPTRELALQVQRELTWLYEYTGARVVSCVGGMDPRREQRELADGADIVVGTPGRLCDHLRRNRLDVSELKAVVLDEADEMLDLGFREDLEFILKTTPEERRTLLFSATLPRGIVALAKEYQRDAYRIEVAGGERGHADIEYRAIRVAPADVEHAVVNLLRFFESPGALVFCNTRSSVNHLQAALLERGFSVVALSGELSQTERTHALQALRDGRSRVCVATDVAARGIDLPNLGLVIHADLPNDPETLQHRSGRTGRAGRKGISVMLVPPARRRKAEILLRIAGVDAVWGTAPQPDEIRKLDQQRLLQDDLLTGEPSEDDLALARLLMAERPAETIAAALARMYRARLPAPEDIVDPGRDTYRDRFADRGKGRDARGARAGDDFDSAPRKPRSPRREMANGSKWFRVSAGHRKHAEARWLLPMICRRGGVEKNDIGAIRIYEHHSEFEIAAEAAERFVDKIKRPDKEQHVILPLPDGPQGEQTAARPSAAKSGGFDAKPEGQSEAKSFVPPPTKPLDHKEVAVKAADAGSDEVKAFEIKPYGKKSFDKKPFEKKPAYDKKRPFDRHRNGDHPRDRDNDRKPPRAHESGRDESASFGKPKFGKSKFDKPKFGHSKFDKPKFDKSSSGEARGAKGPAGAKGPKKPKKNKQKKRLNPMIAD
ncbi:MAG: DEAD/DEAH box helicase [Rhodopseudomonas sp.]|nr:DEAD/DEAH box helicase [Rhodopseudomonas sp.]